MDRHTHYLWQTFSSVAVSMGLASEVWARLLDRLPTEKDRADASMALDALRKAQSEAHGLQMVLEARTLADTKGGVQ